MNLSVVDKKVNHHVSFIFINRVCFFWSLKWKSHLHLSHKLFVHFIVIPSNLHANTQVDNMKFLEVLDVHAQCEKYILMMKNSVIFFFKY